MPGAFIRGLKKIKSHHASGMAFDEMSAFIVFTIDHFDLRIFPVEFGHQ
jgi:hypothetical protein